MPVRRAPILLGIVGLLLLMLIAAFALVTIHREEQAAQSTRDRNQTPGDARKSPAPKPPPFNK